MSFCYILYSKSLDRFYIGSTELPVKDRLALHLDKAYGANKYTAKANDWIIYFEIPFTTISEARKAESYIKKMKSREFYKKLKNDKAFLQGMIERL